MKNTSTSKITKIELTSDNISASSHKDWEQIIDRNKYTFKTDGLEDGTYEYRSYIEFPNGNIKYSENTETFEKVKGNYFELYCENDKSTATQINIVFYKHENINIEEVLCDNEKHKYEYFYYGDGGIEEHTKGIEVNIKPGYHHYRISFSGKLNHIKIYSSPTLCGGYIPFQVIFDISDDNLIQKLSTTEKGNYILTVPHIKEINSFFGNSLKSVEINGNIELIKISEYAFGGCASLQSVNLSGCTNLTSIRGSAFNNCSSLASFDLSGCSNLTEIGTWMLQNCSSLSSFDLSGCTNLTSIGEDAFWDCSSLSSFDLSGCTNLTSIGEDAFRNCSSLASFDLSGCTNLTEIGEDAFWNCSSLASFDLSGCANLAIIKSWAFKNCSSLSSVNLSGCANLTEIGNNAFQNCSSLSSVNLSGCTNLTSIGHWAFSDCSSLSSFDLSGCANLTEIGSSAFENCKISKIVIPKTVTDIDVAPFDGCPLKSVYCYPINPPNTFLGFNPFPIGGNNYVKIYVPASSVEIYKEKWGEWEYDDEGNRIRCLNIYPM